MVVMNTHFHNLGSHKGPEDPEVPEDPWWQKVQEVKEMGSHEIFQPNVISIIRDFQEVSDRRKIPDVWEVLPFYV